MQYKTIISNNKKIHDISCEMEIILWEKQHSLQE